MSFDFLTRVADRKIEEAIAEGAFEHLPGMGQPLRLDDMPAHLRILKNAGILPDWMQLEKEIEAARAECVRLRAQVGKEYPKRRAKADESESQRRIFAGWLARSRDTYFQAIKRVNGDILKLNLLAPSILRERVPFRLAEERARFDTEFPPLPGEAAVVPAPPEEPRVSGVRLSAQEHYRHKTGEAHPR